MPDQILTDSAIRGEPSGLLALVPGFSGGSSGLMWIACIALGVVAATAFAQTLSARREARGAARTARERARTIGELLRTVRMAETIADLGVWQYDPASGQQHWSKGLRAIFGIDSDDALVDGDAQTVLFANDVDLVSGVTLHCAETEPYQMQFDVIDCEGTPRAFTVQACNLRGASGAVVRVIAVVRDHTHQLARERDLQLSRAQALSEAREARELASTDPLTGLANRRKIMSEIDRLLMRARTTEQALSLIMFDLDHFKTVNDTFGHLLGDKVLKRVSDIALSQAREGDIIGRVGGEEFVWIVPGADEATAHRLAERLRQAIALTSAVDAAPGVTASVGCAEVQPGDSTLTLFARADSALYDAKNAGRNQVWLAA